MYKTGGGRGRIIISKQGGGILASKKENISISRRERRKAGTRPRSAKKLRLPGSQMKGQREGNIINSYGWVNLYPVHFTQRRGKRE